jgi:activator of HSP90 ATPase
MMREMMTQSIPAARVTRRHALSGMAMCVAGLSNGFDLWGSPRQQNMKQTPASEANNARTWLHDEVDFTTGPQRIYEVLLDSKQFAAFTGLPAEIDPKAGGAFSMFGGLIVGRNVELLPNERIVQAWRPTHWDPGVYSIARFQLKPHGSGTKVVLDHTGFPQGDYDHLEAGWKAHYWDGLAKYLG